MIVIGICGSSGSGKSTVCEYFSEKGIPVLDCDKIYHELISKESACLRDILAAFGKDLIRDGALDRKKLGRIVFSDPDKLKLLNRITHHHVLLELEERMKDLKLKGEKICMIDAPMLFEAKLEERCDFVCAVVSDEDSQIRRMCLRDGIDLAEARLRLTNQISPEELKKRADFVVENSGDLSQLKSACEDLLCKISSLKGK